MEILAAVQAIDLKGKRSLGIGTNAAYKLVRNYTDFIDNDRIMYKEINICEELVKENKLVLSVEKASDEKLLVNEDI